MNIQRVALVGADPLRLADSSQFDVVHIDRQLGDIARVRDVDLVVEALSEQPNHLPVKEAVLQEIDAQAPRHVIVATQRGPWLVTDLAEQVQHPARLVGFNSPVADGSLVEVMGHRQSDPLRLEAVWAWLNALGRTPLAAADAPGGVVRRIAVPWMNEAVRLLEEGHCISAIDNAAMQAFGCARGPFSVMNTWGVAHVAAAAEQLGEALGAFYGPAPRLLAQDNKMWPEAELLPVNDRAVGDRLWGVVLHVALEMISEHVSSPRDIDVGACGALGWARGPFVAIDAQGPTETARLARFARERYGLWAPPALQTMVHEC